MRLLLALVLAGSAWGAADPDLLAFLSPDARFILGFRIEPTRGTSLDQLIRDTWPSEEWPTWSGVRFEEVAEIAAGESVVIARLGVKASLSTSAIRETYRDATLVSVPEQVHLNAAATVGE